MNKKFIALTSTIALLLAPATSVLAEGDNSTADSENTQTEEPTTTDGESTQAEEPTITDGESTQAEEPTITDGESTQAEEPTITDGESTQAEEPTTTDSESTQTEVPTTTDSKSTQTEVSGKGTLFYSVYVNGADFISREPWHSIYGPKLANKKIVECVGVSIDNLQSSNAVTFKNAALFKQGHTYKVHVFDIGSDEEFEAPEAVAINGEFTVTIHDDSIYSGTGNLEFFIEDLGVVNTSSDSNGRKAALNTGVK